jgi:hypothetical protein
LVQLADDVKYELIILNLKKMGMNSNDIKWRRLSATKTLNDLREDYRITLNEKDADKKMTEFLNKRIEKLTEMIDEVKLKTKSRWLLDAYKNYRY